MLSTPNAVKTFTNAAQIFYHAILPISNAVNAFAVTAQKPL
jgi:hypothetical protein